MSKSKFRETGEMYFHGDKAKDVQKHDDINKWAEEY